VVFTNGVFDLLHRGHVTYLAQARALGACLVVALNSDASARRLGKGEGRPVNGLEDRMALVAALASTDAVTWFEEDTPAALIEALRPDVLVKGGDWPVDRIVGGRETLARGGRVVSIPFEHQRSSTSLLERIRKG
jgi:rfaE bifunctional protein nucleotidyltransferase chain/domain